jgi:hypothetical protein
MELNFWASIAAAQKATGVKVVKVTDRRQLTLIVVGALIAMLALACFVSIILSDYH